MTKNRKNPPNVGELYNFSKQEITLNTMGNSSKTKGKGSGKTQESKNPKHKRKKSIIEIITPESRQVIEEILDILSEPSISVIYFQRSAYTDTDLKLAKILAGMYNEHCWSLGESISLHLLQTEILALQLYLSTKKICHLILNIS